MQTNKFKETIAENSSQTNNYFYVSISIAGPTRSDGPKGVRLPKVPERGRLGGKQPNGNNLSSSGARIG